MPSSITIVARPHKGDFRLHFLSAEGEEHVTVDRQQASSIVHAAYEAGMHGHRVEYDKVVLHR
jgi:hypothetical protein